MFNGAHVVIYSADAEADRLVFRDILKLPNVDVGGGWLIFALHPPRLRFTHTNGQRHMNSTSCVTTSKVAGVH
jgi:hypothetical protein